MVMSDIDRLITGLPLEQQAIRARCFHPSGSFIDFRKEEVEQSIPNRFEQIVAKHPDRVAIKTRNSSLTYEALNRAANRVAHALLSQCEHKTESVTLLVERDASTIVAMLGILKAGKICVPLDPSLPETRTADILEYSEVAAIVTGNKNLPGAARISKNIQRLVNLDLIAAQFSTGNVALDISPDALAFIIHTSGSTGTPKGVMQSHRNILHWTLKTTNGFHICADDRIGLLASLAGGQAKATAFNALLNGATLCAFNVKEEGMTHLADWLISEGITIYTSAATIFRDFVKTLTGKEKFPKLRLVRLGAEQVRKTDVELYKKHFPPQCLFGTMLSSSETGALCQYLLNEQTEIADETVPVGYPAEDVQIVLINDTGEKVGFLETGEITVRSRYLSPGYWRRPDLTQVKFLPDPDGGDKRIYLTGDLGRMRLDGCLEHLGRKDFRVKIRGFGVELEEVEATLRLHPTVRETVVEARMDESKDNCLIAYIVPDQDRAPTISELRHFLEAKLPEHMIPSAFMILDAMPLTPNGKIDRRALPDPGRSRPELDALFVPPRTPVEEELVRIWAEVLSLEQIGIYDRFFDLGGHSLAAARVVSRVFKTFELELPIQSLFQSPTVAEMAAMITQNEAKKLRQEELTQILAELESLSEQEAKEFAIREGAPTTKSTKR
jgi:amino acid adenylation domain-containing protein